MAEKTNILLADADILIDYLNAGLSILKLTSTHIGPVHVLTQVLETVDGLSQTQCTRHKITIIEAETDLLLNAGKRTGALSFEDWLCYLTCEKEGWVCVTNDQALIRACQQNSIEVKRGLRLMINLVQDGHLTRKKALKVAKTIQASNPHHINEHVLNSFKKALD